MDEHRLVATHRMVRHPDLYQHLRIVWISIVYSVIHEPTGDTLDRTQNFEMYVDRRSGFFAYRAIRCKTTTDLVSE